jgi:hypothetical protein
VGETRVDLLHLLEDLRDAYPGALEETIVTEIVANALDSGASRIAIHANPADATFTVVDNGSGMRRRELGRYHDVAASTKTRGQGIGFAGVGIKLGLLLCERVITETRRGKTHVASEWHLASRHRAPWKWVPPPGLVAERGTAVRLCLRNPLSPLLDGGFIEGALRRHYEALLDPLFAPVLAAQYPRGVRFEIGGHVLEHDVRAAEESAPIEVRLGRKKKPAALGYLFRAPHIVPDERHGVAVSTLGKVIKRGWDWLGLTPIASDRIGGLVDVPALAECLTLNKSDFIRTGPRGALYLAYRKALQEAVSRQLALWGDMRDAAEAARQRVARPVARDLERVVMDLAEAFPLLATLVEHRRGAQQRLLAGAGRTAGPEYTLEIAPAPQAREVVPPSPAPATAPEDHEPRASDRTSTGTSAITLPRDDGGPPRPARYGLRIEFEDRPDDTELARLVESTVWVNSAHPAYLRAAASRSEGYHIALAAALALARLAVEPADAHGFVTAFLLRWGQTLDRRPRGRRANR